MQTFGSSVPLVYVHLLFWSASRIFFLTLAVKGKLHNSIVDYFICFYLFTKESICRPRHSRMRRLFRWNSSWLRKAHAWHQ